MAKLQIVQFKSANGTDKGQRATLQSLGLGKIGSKTERDDSPQLRGMIAAVSHLVKVEGG